MTLLNHLKLSKTTQTSDPKYDFVTDPALYLTDHNENGILERMVKFDRMELIDYLDNADLGEPMPPDEDSAAHKVYVTKPKVKAEVDPPRAEAWCSPLPYLEVWKPDGEVVKPE